MQKPNCDSIALQRLIEISTDDEESEVTTYKLLLAFGSAENAVGQLDYSNAESLGINSKLVDIFASIREIGLNSLYRKISEDDPDLCASRIVEYFQAQFPERKVCIIQFFFFFGESFVGCSRPAHGSINDVAITGASIFAEALQANASRILPVIGLPEGNKRAYDCIKWKLEILRESGKFLEIETDLEVII